MTVSRRRALFAPTGIAGILAAAASWGTAEQRLSASSRAAALSELGPTRGPDAQPRMADPYPSTPELREDVSRQVSELKAHLEEDGREFHAFPADGEESPERKTG